jgi:hypothetical protein
MIAQYDRHEHQQHRRRNGNDDDDDNENNIDHNDENNNDDVPVLVDVCDVGTSQHHHHLHHHHQVTKLLSWEERQEALTIVDVDSQNKGTVDDLRKQSDATLLLQSSFLVEDTTTTPCLEYHLFRHSTHHDDTTQLHPLFFNRKDGLHLYQNQCQRKITVLLSTSSKPIIRSRKKLGYMPTKQETTLYFNSNHSNKHCTTPTPPKNDHPMMRVNKKHKHCSSMTITGRDIQGIRLLQQTILVPCSRKPMSTIIF